MGVIVGVGVGGTGVGVGVSVRAAVGCGVGTVVGVGVTSSTRWHAAETASSSTTKMMPSQPSFDRYCMCLTVRAHTPRVKERVHDRRVSLVAARLACPAQCVEGDGDRAGLEPVAQFKH